MQSFNKAMLDILHRRGAMEIRFLVRTVRRSTPVRRAEEALVEEILIAALNGKTGITVKEYPTYRLKASPKSVKLPTGRYARTALLALKEAAGQMALPALVHRYNAKYKQLAPNGCDAART
ncbi:MAG: hypothetical protein NTY38_15160 [Acidobacteria bacterium]|nr:hypothetical protein [Acidobacteriota bacterium]